MNHFVLNESWIDAILGLVILEGLLLVAWRAWTGRGPKPGPLIANLLAGGFILLALRAGDLWRFAGLDRDLPRLFAYCTPHRSCVAVGVAKPKPSDAPVTRACNSLYSSKRQIPQAPIASNVELTHA